MPTESRSPAAAGLRTRYGFFADYNFNFQRADFRALPGVPNCCPRFTGGSGQGITFGALLEIPIARSLLLDFRPVYSINSASLTDREPVTVSVGGTVAPGIFEHAIDARIDRAGLESLLDIRLSRPISLLLGGGAYAVVRKTYDQRETIVEPAETGTFENGLRVRNEYGGDIPEARSLQTDLLMGVSCEFPLNRAATTFGALELFYGIGLASIVKDLAWHMNQLRLGIAVKWSPAPPPPPPMDAATEQKSETPVPTVAPASTAKLSIGAVRAAPAIDGERSIRIEEFSSTQLKPLLPYVFFAKDSARIPIRYAALDPDSARRFRVEDLHHLDALPVYYHLLNIIGRRMREYPKGFLTITGCNSGEGTEMGSRKLSRARAIVVRDYLRNVWGIPEARMKIVARDLPEKFSRPADPDGMAENRRVEIDADDWRIIRPVVTTQNLSALATRGIAFSIQAPPGNARSWELSLSREGKQLGRMSGGNPLPRALEWRLDESFPARFAGDAPLTATFRFVDSAGERSETPPLSIPVRHVTVLEKQKSGTPGRTLDKFSLILFDFDSSSFTRYHRNTMGMINERLIEGSDITVMGYTDRMGEEERNMSLSRNRAAAAAKALAVAPAEVTGRGETLLFDNDLPEGRMYNRTVEILALHPAGK